VTVTQCRRIVQVRHIDDAAAFDHARVAVRMTVVMSIVSVAVVTRAAVDQQFSKLPPLVLLIVVEIEPHRHTHRR